MRRHNITILALLCLPFGAGAQTAAEGAKFTVSVDGPVWMFFGDKGTDRFNLRKYWRGTWDCSVAGFRADPAPGASKECFASGTGGLIAEGSKFTVPDGTATVWFGNGAKFRTRTLPIGTSQWTCDSATMGGDPSYGVVKFCRATAYTDSLGCFPRQLGGSGTWAAWGATLSPVQAWAGWICPDKVVQSIACVAEGCKPDVFKRAVSTTDLAAANVALQGARTAHVDKGPVADLISLHWAEIVATRP
jgi:hypothetical protein